MTSKLVDRDGINTSLNVFGCRLPAYVVVFFLICFAFVYSHLFIFPFTPIFFEEDHLYILHDAWRMYEGEVIYRDFFQIMYPGTQLLYLAFFYLFGLRFWIVDVIILLQVMVSVMLCLAISRKLIGDAWYALLPPAIYVFFGFRWFGIDGNHRVFSPIFAYLAGYVLLAERSYKRIALAGAICGIASFFTQQRGLLAIGGITLFLICEGIFNRDAVSEIAKKVVTAGGAFAVTLAALILPFVVAAGPEKFFRYTLFFITNYVQDSTANYHAYVVVAKGVFAQGYIMSATVLFYYALIPLVYLATLGYLWFSRKGRSGINDREGVLLFCLIGLALSLGTFGPSPFRLYQVAVPALIMFGWLVYQLRPRSDLAVKFAVAGLIVFGSALAIRIQTKWEPTILEAPTGNIAFLSPVPLEKFAWLQNNAEPNDAVFEVYQCAVNFPLLLRNPTEATHVLNTGYSPPWQVAGVIDSLEASKARFVIWDSNWDSEMPALADGERLKPLQKYLHENYELRKEFTPYSGRSPQIWERKN